MIPNQSTPYLDAAHFVLSQLTGTPNDTYEDVLNKWQAVQALAKQLTSVERDLRMGLFTGGVPKPVEGTNKLELRDGRVCVFTVRYNRKITDVRAAQDALRAAGFNDTDTIIVPKYELAVGPYKKLGGPARAVLDVYVVTTPGLPSLEVK